MFAKCQVKYVRMVNTRHILERRWGEAGRDLFLLRVTMSKMWDQRELTDQKWSSYMMNKEKIRSGFHTTDVVQLCNGVSNLWAGDG